MLNVNSRNDDNVKTQHDSNIDVDNSNENLQLLIHNMTTEALNIDNNTNSQTADDYQHKVSEIVIIDEKENKVKNHLKNSRGSKFC